MGIPIFLQPAHVVRQGSIEGMAVRGTNLSFRVKNTGNIHFMEQAVRVQGLGITGDSLLDQQQAGRYVLAGGLRIHELDLPKDTCAKIRTLAVGVQTEGRILQERFDVPSGACGQ